MTEGYVLSTGLATGLDEELVREVASVLNWFSCDQCRLTEEEAMDAAARAVLQTRAWQLRRAADEAAHAKRRDDSLRLADLAQAAWRTRVHMATRHS